MKFIRTTIDHEEYGDNLAKQGYVQIGSGCMARVFAHRQRSTRVIKVGRV